MRSNCTAQPTILWAPVFYQINHMNRECERTQEDEFFKSYDPSVDLDTRYPKDVDDKDEQEQNRASRVVATFYRMKIAIESYSDLDPKEREFRTAQSHKAWTRAFHQSTGKKLPDIDPHDVKMPNLGPMECFSEDYMELYSRVFAIATLFNLHNGPQRLANFIGNARPFESKPIGAEFTPRWMIIQDAERLEEVLDSSTDSPLPLKKFQARWTMSHSSEDPKKYIKDNGLEKEVTAKQVANEDPRIF